MTDRLAAADAAFLFAEEPAAPRQVGGVVILEPVDGFDYQRMSALVSQRLGRLPRYRQVVRFVPGRLARPVWVDDDGFDLSYHLRRSSLPQPGSMAQLAELVGRLISRPLDRSRPLWELYLVEGLADGRAALINKTHEALVSGVGAVDIAAALLDDAPVGPAPADEPFIPAPAPSAIDLVVDAVADILSRPAESWEAARLLAVDLRTTLGRITQTAVAITEVVRRSMQPLSGSVMRSALGGPRVYATAQLDLAVIKDVRRRVGTSVNDVILAVVAGALRSWLLSSGEPVDGSATLRTLVPMSVRAESDDSGVGADPGTAATDPGDAGASADAVGQALEEMGAPPGVTSYLVDLPVGEANPLMRLHQVGFATASHRESGRRVGADALLELGRLAPPSLHAMGARVASQLSRRSYDLLVTNVPGPQHQLYAAGDAVSAMYPVVPLARGHAVAVGCTSYRGTVYVGITADRDAMADVSEFAGFVVESLDELTAAVRPRGRGRGVARSARTGSESADGRTADGREG